MRRNATRTGLTRKPKHMRLAIRTWVNRLPDVPAFIVGNSPSLNDFDLDLIKDYFSIGVNRAFYALDPTILMWQDISLWNTEYHKLHYTKALKVSRDVSDPRKIYYNFRLRSDYQFNPDITHVLYGRGSTGPLAVELAVAMGCCPIVLLGMDCARGENNVTDFYGNNKHWTENTELNCFQGLEFIKEKCPVEIRNCGSSGLWSQETLEEVLSQIPSRHARSRKSYVDQILNVSS